MKKFDVIIIGLGPAGAAAAMDLAGAGARVLVVDGSGVSAKPCGGCLSLRAVRALAPFGPPAWLYDYPVSTLWLTGPGRRPGRYDTDQTGCYFIDRGRLDAFLAQKTAAAGVEIVKSKARFVVDQGNGYKVACPEGVFKSDWLLGSDGANSIVGRAFGLGWTNREFVALVENRPMPARLAEPLKNAAVIELGGIRGGYGWLFGLGDTLNLGMAGQRGKLAASGGLKRSYGRFLARHGLVAGGNPRGAVIPYPRLRPCRRSRARAAVIGDAAALADPFLGEGIAPAIVSGRMAAGAIIAGNMGLYESRLGQTLLRDHWHSVFVAGLIYGWPGLALNLVRRHPGGIELGWRLLRGEVASAKIWSEVIRGFRGLPPNLDPQASAYYSCPVS